MKKIGTFITLVCILNFLAIGGLFGYLFGTGRLNKPKAQVIVDMLKTQNSPDDLRVKVYDVLYPITATQPATSTAPATAPAVTADDAPATAAERNEYVRRTLESERLQLENEAQDLRNRQQWLAQSQVALDQKYKAFDAEKKTFEAQSANAGKQKDDSAFQKMMTLFDDLKPKQIKDLLMAMQTDEASRYVDAMDPEQAAKIIGEFKTQPEQDALHAILDRVRGAARANGTSAASDKAADLTAAVPSAKVGP